MRFVCTQVLIQLLALCYITHCFAFIAKFSITVSLCGVMLFISTYLGGVGAVGFGNRSGVFANARAFSSMPFCHKRTRSGYIHHLSYKSRIKEFGCPPDRKSYV